MLILPPLSLPCPSPSTLVVFARCCHYRLLPHHLLIDVLCLCRLPTKTCIVNVVVRLVAAAAESLAESSSLTSRIVVARCCHRPCPYHLLIVFLSALEELIISSCHWHHQHCRPLYLLLLAVATSATGKVSSSFSSVIIITVDVYNVVIVIVVRCLLLSSPLLPLFVDCCFLCPDRMRHLVSLLASSTLSPPPFVIFGGNNGDNRQLQRLFLLHHCRCCCHCCHHCCHCCSPLPSPSPLSPLLRCVMLEEGVCARRGAINKIRCGEGHYLGAMQKRK